MARHDFAGGAVILDHRRIVDGDVVGALLEVIDGISAGDEDGIDESVGLSDGAGGIVDEAALDGGPIFGEALAVGGRERTKVNFSTRFSRSMRTASARRALPCCSTVRSYSEPKCCLSCALLR